MRRVVLTSSVAAVRSSGASTPPVNPPLFSEQDWNEVSDWMTGLSPGPGLTEQAHCLSLGARCRAHAHGIRHLATDMPVCVQWSF